MAWGRPSVWEKVTGPASIAAGQGASQPDLAADAAFGESYNSGEDSRPVALREPPTMQPDQTTPALPPPAAGSPAAMPAWVRRRPLETTVLAAMLVAVGVLLALERE